MEMNHMLDLSVGGFVTQVKIFNYPDPLGFLISKTENDDTMS